MAILFSYRAMDLSYQNATGPSDTPSCAMTAGTNQTGAVRGTSNSPIVVDDELVFTAIVSVFSGDEIQVYHNNTDVGDPITEAGRYVIPHTATHTSSFFQLVSGGNPGNGAAHVIAEFTVEREEA